LRSEPCPAYACMYDDACVYGGVQIGNVLQSTCSFRIRPANADRISVEPSTLSLAPGEVKRVQVKLKLQGKTLPKKKGGAPYRYSDARQHILCWRTR
jgi:hypothetical protein